MCQVLIGYLLYTQQHTYATSVDGHLGCFHVLTIVNSAAVSTGVHVSFYLFISYWGTVTYDIVLVSVVQ